MCLHEDNIPYQSCQSAHHWLPQRAVYTHSKRVPCFCIQSASQTSLTYSKSARSFLLPDHLIHCTHIAALLPVLALAQPLKRSFSNATCSASQQRSTNQRLSATVRQRAGMGFAGFPSCSHASAHLSSTKHAPIIRVENIPRKKNELVDRSNIHLSWKHFLNDSKDAPRSVEFASVKRVKPYFSITRAATPLISPAMVAGASLLKPWNVPPAS